MAKLKENTTREFTREVTKVNLAYKQFIQQKLRQNNVDLTFEMLLVLSSLWQQDGINQQELANLTVKDKASMTYLLDNLTKRLLVYRQEDAADRRNKMIFLTPQGKALQVQVQPWVSEMYCISQSGISLERINECIGVLVAMQKNLRKVAE